MSVPAVTPAAEVLSEFNLEKLAAVGRFGGGWPAAADFSPDGSLLALASARGVEVFRTDEWRVQTVFPTDTPVLAVLFSPGGEWLAAGRQDGKVVVLDTVSWKIILRLAWHSRPVHGLAFSGWSGAGSQPAYLASGSEEGSVVVWDISSGIARHKFENPLLGYWGYGIRSLAFSADDSVLVTGGDQGYLSRWDLATGEELPRLQTQFGLLFGVAFSPDGARLASACGDGTVQIWDWDTEEPLALLPGHAYGAWSVAWSVDGKRLATSSGDGMVKLWDAETATLERESAAAFTKIDSLRYSPDGARLAAVSIGERALILDARSLSVTREFLDFTGGLRSAAFYPSGEWAAISGENGLTYLWNLSGGEVIPLGGIRPASKADVAAVFSPRGEILAVADGLAGILRIYDLAELSPRSETRVPGVRAVAFSPDGGILAAGGNGELTVIDTASGKIRILKVGSRITGLTFVAGSEASSLRLAVAMEDGSIRLWDPAAPEKTPQVFSDGGGSPVWCVAGAGTLLAAGDDRGDIRIWDTSSGQLLRTVSGYMGSIFSLALAPDGSLLAAGGIHGSIRFWSMNRGRLLRTVPAHNGWVNGLAFSPDGRHLMSAGSDGSAIVWGVPG